MSVCSLALEGGGAVHRTRVEVLPAQRVCDGAGDGGLPGPRGAIDGDAHAIATIDATLGHPAPVATHAFATMATVKLLRPLRERDFALLWTGMTVSLLGDGIYTVAVAWQVYELHNDPSALALVGLAWTGGLVLFILLAGVLSDRLDRRRVMIGADMLRARSRSSPSARSR